MDPLDPLENSGRLDFVRRHRGSATFTRKMGSQNPGRALGGPGRALEALGELRESSGRPWESFGRVWRSSGRALGGSGVPSKIPFILSGADAGIIF